MCKASALQTVLSLTPRPLTPQDYFTNSFDESEEFQRFCLRLGKFLKGGSRMAFPVIIIIGSVIFSYH